MLLLLATPLLGQGGWAAAKCGSDLKPNHYLVNSGLLYLKSATSARFDDQKRKDLADAQRTLMQALTTGGQDKNPAAWYYLGRYYVLTNDAQGMDSAFSRTLALKPDCKDDIAESFPCASFEWTRRSRAHWRSSPIARTTSPAGAACSGCRCSTPASRPGRRTTPTRRSTRSAAPCRSCRTIRPASSISRRCTTTAASRIRPSPTSAKRSTSRRAIRSSPRITRTRCSTWAAFSRA